jgi:hypothetical protein
MHWISPINSYGREIWILGKFGPFEKRIKKKTSTEMKFFRRTAGYTLFDHQRNEEVLEEMKVKPVDEKLRRHKSNGLRHVTRMNSNSNKNSAEL